MAVTKRFCQDFVHTLGAHRGVVRQQTRVFIFKLQGTLLIKQFAQKVQGQPKLRVVIAVKVALNQDGSSLFELFCLLAHFREAQSLTQRLSELLFDLDDLEMELIPHLGVHLCLGLALDPFLQLRVGSFLLSFCFFAHGSLYHFS